MLIFYIKFTTFSCLDFVEEIIRVYQKTRVRPENKTIRLALYNFPEHEFPQIPALSLKTSLPSTNLFLISEDRG